MATAHHVRRARRAHSARRRLQAAQFSLCISRSRPRRPQAAGAAREETGLAIVTEVMSECDVALVAEYADILQIGSRSMENYSLLEAAARSGRADSAETRHGGNDWRSVCVRRRSFSTTAIPTSFSASAASAPLKRRCATPSTSAGNRAAQADHASSRHCRSQPRGRASRPGSGTGAHRVAAGADGLLVEVHPDPDKAGATANSLSTLLDSTP